ncbi:MAG: hypothetical protein QM775_19905 [Pirellulales bacterium]
MDRRTFVRLLGGSTAAVVCGAAALQAAPPPQLGTGLSKTLNYQKELELGLKARRPTDFAFIATVVARVESGKLPQNIVNETFDFARKQSRQYPFIYFQFALRKRTEKLGVVL